MIANHTKIIKLLNLLFIFSLIASNCAYSQILEMNVVTAFNKQFSNVNKKPLTVNDSIVTLKLNEYSKQEITFFLPKNAKLVSVFADGQPIEHAKHGSNFVNVPVNKKTKEIAVTTRETMPPVYIANKITATDLKNRIGSFSLEIPLPAVDIPASKWTIYGEDNIFFTKEALAEKVASAIDYLESTYKNNSETIQNYAKNKYAIGAIIFIAIIFFCIFFGYIKRLFKMIAWFAVWPRKYVKPAGFVLLFLMFGGVLFYFYNLWCSFVPSLPQEISKASEACSITRKSLLNKLSSSKDATTNNIQTLIDKGVINKEEFHCPQFGFYNYDGNNVNCTVHSKNKNNGLLFYQIKVQTQGSSASFNLPAMKEPKQAMSQNFFFADKAISYTVFAIIGIVFFFFVFIPIILAKPLDASYNKLFKKNNLHQ